MNQPSGSRRISLAIFPKDKCLLLAGILLFLLTGCATWSPPPLPEEYRTVEYFPISPRGVECTVQEMTTEDNRRLAYIRYLPSHGEPQVAFLYLHGIESHSGWFKGAAEQLALRGYAVYCLDRRGSGINREPRGFPSGDIDHWNTWVSDIHRLQGKLAEAYPEIHLIGLSWGGKLAMAYAATYPNDFLSIVLITPGIRSHFDPSLLTRSALPAAASLFPSRRYRLPIAPEMFSDSPVFQEKISRDPLRLKEVTLRFLRESGRLDRLIDKRIKADIKAGILLLLAGKDPIIDNEGVLKVLSRGTQIDYTVIVMPDQIHSLQFDALEDLVRHIDRWTENRIWQQCNGEGVIGK